MWHIYTIELPTLGAFVAASLTRMLPRFSTAYNRNTAKVATNWGASSVIYVNLSVLTTHVVASFALLHIIIRV
jgi:hypothetical protein